MTQPATPGPPAEPTGGSVGAGAAADGRDAGSPPGPRSTALQRLLDRAVAGTGAARGVAMAVDRSRGLLICRAVNGLPDCPPESILYRLGQGNMARVAVSGKPLRTHLPSLDAGPNQTALLMVPVRAGGNVAAVLSLNGSPTAQGFSAADEASVVLLADEAGPQIQREIDAPAHAIGESGWTLSSLVDRGLLQEIQEGLAEVLGLPCAFEDPHGRCLLPISRAADFCVLMRSRPNAALRCELSMARAGSEAEDRRTAVKCECHAGVQTLVQPVFARQHFLGSLVVMLRYGARDAATVRGMAIELGLDPYEALAKASMFASAAPESEDSAAEVAAIVARMVGAIAENAIAARGDEERLAQKSGELGALRELSRRLVGITDVGLVAREVARRAVELSGELAADVTTTGADGRLQLTAQTGLSPDVVELLRQSLADSPASAAMRSHDVVRVEEVSRESRYPAWTHALRRQTKVRSVVAMPLGPGERPTGALTVYSASQQTAPQSALLGALAEHASLAITAAQAAERAESNEQAIRAFLSQMTRGMSSSIDKESLVQWVADFACEMAHASHVVLYEADGDELVVAATGRTGRTVIERPKLSFGEGLSGRVAVERRMSQVPNIRKDPRFVTSSANVPADAVSYVGAPLLYKNDLLGVLAVYTRTQIYSEDDLQLISSFAAQAAVAIQNARTYEHQFEIATTMQQSFLPREKLKLAGVEVGGVWEPSQGEVGGDYYDFIPVDDARAVIVLGDVSGKGIRAATYTAMGKYVLRAYAHEDPSPEGLLRRTNAVLASGMEVGTFITMFCALIDVGAATLRYANGGHPDGLLFHPATGEYTPLVSTGMMVGAIPGEDFGGVTIALSPGDLLVLYTDGVLEARHGEELYGSDRLKAFIRANAGLEPEVLARAIHEQVRAFHDTGVADDTCVIVLRFIGKNAQ